MEGKLVNPNGIAHWNGATQGNLPLEVQPQCGESGSWRDCAAIPLGLPRRTDQDVEFKSMLLIAVIDAKDEDSLESHSCCSGGNSNAIAGCGSLGTSLQSFEKSCRKIWQIDFYCFCLGAISV